MAGSPELVQGARGIHGPMMKASYEIWVAATPERCFDAWVNEVDAWWPREGRRFRYTWAPDATAPDRIRFEPRLGGRYWETFADGSEYEIGRITAFDRPRRLAYTWRGPTWSAATDIEVTFDAEGDGTRVEIIQSGWERLGDEAKQLRDGYEHGMVEVVGAFARCAHVT